MKKNKSLPKDTEEVFDGIIFSIYQWKQEMFSGPAKIFEKASRKDTVVVIPVTEDGKILITEEKQPDRKKFTCVVRGLKEDNESVKNACLRELLEETGMTAERLILWDKRNPHPKIDWTVYILFARNLKKVSDKKLDGGEKIKVKTVTYEKFIQMAIDEKFDEHELNYLILKTWAKSGLIGLKKIILEK